MWRAAYYKKTSIEDFIEGIPKAELHLHIEGTFEPELMFKIAERNNIKTGYNSIKGLKKAYKFSNLQDFLDIYYEGANVLTKKQDFYDLTYAYLKKAHSQNVLHAEIFFDPQTHTYRGISFSTVIEGIHDALVAGKKDFGISAKLIMCFLRHLSEDSAMKTLNEALAYKDWITAVGLDSSEAGNPPSKFKTVFKKARKAGFLTVAHAGEEGPAGYIKEALHCLKVSRIDHGNRALDDDCLVGYIVKRKMPLTLCPLSNLKLKVVKSLSKHPLKVMMDKGMIVTVNSDDPAYFRGYMNENYKRVAKALGLSKEDIAELAKNSFKASFLSKNKKKDMCSRIDGYLKKHS